MKIIHKYPTGTEVPDNAIYLNTIIQKRIPDKENEVFIECWLVWHYFLIDSTDYETKPDKKEENKK